MPPSGRTRQVNPDQIRCCHEYDSRLGCVTRDCHHPLQLTQRSPNENVSGPLRDTPHKEPTSPEVFRELLTMLQQPGAATAG